MGLAQAAEIEKILQVKTSDSLHLTLAVSQAHSELKILEKNN